MRNIEDDLQTCEILCAAQSVGGDIGKHYIIKYQEMQKFLKEIEWKVDGLATRFCKDITVETASDYNVWCPVCHHNRKQGHSPDCQLAKLLNKEEQ